MWLYAVNQTNIHRLRSICGLLSGPMSDMLSCCHLVLYFVVVLPLSCTPSGLLSWHYPALYLLNSPVIILSYTLIWFLVVILSYISDIFFLVTLSYSQVSCCYPSLCSVVLFYPVLWSVVLLLSCSIHNCCPILGRHNTKSLVTVIKRCANLRRRVISLSDFHRATSVCEHDVKSQSAIGLG